MRIATCLFCAGILPSAIAQVPVSPSPAPFAPYVRQLGAQHFPGGEAAFLDSIGGVVVLPSGAVVVAGNTVGSLGEAAAGGDVIGDAFVARFDGRGQLQWVRQVGAITGPTIPALNGDANGPGGDASQEDAVAGLAVGSDGSIYVAGVTNGSLGETNGWGSSPGNWDVYVAKFDAHGALQWLRQIGAETAPTIVPPPGATRWGDAHEIELTASIALDAEGRIYVSGATNGDLGEDNLGEDFYVARFDGDGRLEWLRQVGAVTGPLLGYPALHWDDPGALALHPAGMVVLAGTRIRVHSKGAILDAHLLAFDELGEPITSWKLSGTGTESAYDLAIEPGTGDIYLAGSTAGDLADQNIGRQADLFVAKLDATFAVQWITQIGGAAAASLGLLDVSRGDVPGELHLDSSGDLIVAGSTQGSLSEPNAGSWPKRDVFTAKFRGSDGEPLWITQIGQTTAALLGLDASGWDECNSLDLGPQGTIVLGGGTDGSLGETNAGDWDACLIRLTADGGLH